jgi:hypothetical protein
MFLADNKQLDLVCNPITQTCFGELNLHLALLLKDVADSSNFVAVFPG